MEQKNIWISKLLSETMSSRFTHSSTKLSEMKPRPTLLFGCTDKASLVLSELQRQRLSFIIISSLLAWRELGSRNNYIPSKDPRSTDEIKLEYHFHVALRPCLETSITPRTVLHPYLKLLWFWTIQSSEGPNFLMSALVNLKLCF